MMQNVHVKLNPVLPWQSSFQQQEGCFHQQIGLTFKKDASKVQNLEHSYVLRWNLDIAESRSEIPGKFWNVVLEKDG